MTSGVETPPPPAGRIALLGETGLDQVSPGSVGAKAYNLFRMADAGIPVPPLFVLGTATGRDLGRPGGLRHDDLVGLVRAGVRHLERATRLGFGAGRHPLLLAVRSGAAVSMPGMLETLLDVGLDDTTLPGLLRATGDPVFVWDSYRRLVQTYAEVVDDLPPGPFAAVVEAACTREGVASASELDADATRRVVHELRERYRDATRRDFPQDPMEQLLGAVGAVLRSWDSPRAATYRRLQGLGDLTGTAVTVQAMVFGNLGVSSGAGVGFSRDPATGRDELYVDFLLDAQGEDVVAGRQQAGDAGAALAAVPGLRHRLRATARTLEGLFGDAQDFEFTVQEGALWLLQSRSAKRTPWAALQIACDLVDEGLLPPAVARRRLAGYDLEAIVRVRLDPAAAASAVPVAEATPAGAGVAAGRVAPDAAAARRLAAAGDPVALVRPEATTEDIAALAECRALLTATGARTSHAAVVARQLDIVCLVACRELAFDAGGGIRLGGVEVAEGDWLTLDGDGGRVYAGRLPVVEERPDELIRRVRGWVATEPGGDGSG